MALATLLPASLSQSGWSIHHLYIAAAALSVVFLVTITATFAAAKPKINYANPLLPYFKFFYANFLKPFSSSSGIVGQQAALESFYETQAAVYDATRTKLLRGREDMLALLAAQLKHKLEQRQVENNSLVWVDVSSP